MIASPIIVEKDGVKITCSTVDQAVEVARKLGGAFAVSPEEGLRVSRPVDEDWPYSVQELELILAFLTTIQESGQRGADAEKMRKAIQVRNTKAIGPKTVLVNGCLRNLGFPPKSVYNNDRSPKEDRTWKPRSKIDEAIEAVRRKMNG